MKKYKAIVIDGKKACIRLGIILLLGVFFFFALSSILSGSLIESGILFSPKTMVQDIFPAVGAANHAMDEIKTLSEQRMHALVSFLIGFDTGSPKSIINAEFPLAKQMQATGLMALANETYSTPSPTLSQAPLPLEQQEIPEENRAPIKAIDLSPDKSKSGKIILGNQTSYSVDIKEMLSSKPAIDMKGSGPKVLVIHTHATEAYAPEGSTIYDITASDRSQNMEENVVRVGNTLCDILNRKGIETLHDTALHDYPSFNGSYAHSLTAMETYLKKYPSIQIIFDIHRDSIVYSDNTKAKPVTQINGKSAAQLMFVVGTDEKGLEHPNWRENIKSAIHFQNAINQKYPTLMRHINLRQERFNGHTTKASMIIETGASGNSISEAEYGLSLAAECIADYLNSL